MVLILGFLGGLSSQSQRRDSTSPTGRMFSLAMGLGEAPTSIAFADVMSREYDGRLIAFHGDYSRNIVSWLI